MEMIINYRGVDLNCVFQVEDYVPAVLYGDEASPSEGGHIYDLEIYIESVYINDLLSSDQLDNIEDLIHDKL